MGLLTVIRKVRQKQKEIRLLMVGLDNAGKTTVVKHLSGEDIHQVSPTLGFNIKTLMHGDYRVNIWDVGGQKTIRSYWRNYFEQTDGLVWVVDSADKIRLEDCRDELQNLLKEERLAGATLLILANKQDMDGALSTIQIQEELQLHNLGNRHWRVVGCSAVTGQGVQEGFDWLIQDISSRIYLLA